MKAHELIAMLQKCPQDAEVVFFCAWGDTRPVNELSPEDAGGNVVLGSDLPPEVYARDYRHDDAS